MNETQAAAAPAQLGVYTDGEDWVVAASAEDALLVWAAFLGENPEDYIADIDFRRLKDTAEIKVVDEDDGVERKTAARWAAEHGRGYLCGSST